MFKGERIGAILLMGGEGERFGDKVPKQFQPLGEKRVYSYALEALLSLDLFDEILLVCHAEWMGKVRQEIPPSIHIVRAGATRQASSYAGLMSFCKEPNIVLIHDAVRPFVSRRILLENVAKAQRFGAVNTCIPSADTLVYAPESEVVASIPQRASLLRGQTPQTFRYRWALEAHERAFEKGTMNASDDCCLLLNAGRAVHIVQGEEKNFKITTEQDFALARLCVNQLTCSN